MTGEFLGSDLSRGQRNAVGVVNLLRSESNLMHRQVSPPSVSSPDKKGEEVSTRPPRHGSKEYCRREAATKRM